jgi:hypothetical protein
MRKSNTSTYVLGKNRRVNVRKRENIIMRKRNVNYYLLKKGYDKRKRKN